jgi:hypothetical protein
MQTIGKGLAQCHPFMTQDLVGQGQVYGIKLRLKDANTQIANNGF